jgi:hypothetical protein
MVVGGSFRSSQHSPSVEGLYQSNMELCKFTVTSVTRTERIAVLHSLGDWNHPEKRKEFNYVIIGDDGYTYYMHGWRKPIRIVKGQIIKCLRGRSLGGDHRNHNYSIEYHKEATNGYFFSDYMFEKKIDFWVGRHKETIDWNIKEISRLENLKTKATAPNGTIAK